MKYICTNGGLFVIALVYSIWRMISKIRGCSYCHHTNMIPANSPIGKRLLRDLES